MARKLRENKTTEQKLEDVVNQITQTEVLLKSLKTQKKELENKLNQERVEQLLTIIADNDMTIEDAISCIEQVKTDQDKGDTETA